MKIHRVVGTVTLGRSHPTYQGARLRVVEPVDVSELVAGLETAEPQSAKSGSPDMLVVWDEFGAGLGSYVAVSDGGEAAQPFRPQQKAVDAYCAAILDRINIDKNVIATLKSPN